MLLVRQQLLARLAEALGSIDADAHHQCRRRSLKDTIRPYGWDNVYPCMVSDRLASLQNGTQGTATGTVAFHPEMDPWTPPLALCCLAGIVSQLVPHVPGQLSILLHFRCISPLQPLQQKFKRFLFTDMVIGMVLCGGYWHHHWPAGMGIDAHYSHCWLL
jgi:hypothetical protein